MKVYVDGMNADITLDEKTHHYSCVPRDMTENSFYVNDNSQLSGTGIISLFQKYSFEEPNWSMYLGIVRKRNPEKQWAVMNAIKNMKYAYSEHMDWRKSRGTELHLKAERGELPKIENMIDKLNWDKENNIIIRELKMFTQFNGIDIAGTIDLMILNNKTFEIILVDYKFSNVNKKSYLDKQLNIYMAFLESIGFTCRGLKGVTIKDNEEMTIHSIVNKRYDMEAIVKVVGYFNE